VRDDRKTSETETQHVVGIAWYRRDQWARLREISLDADEIEATYDEWLECAWKRMSELRQHGCEAQRVDVDTEELLRWCTKKGVRVDAAARSEFAAERVRCDRQ
jgi:hypothetical protein